LDRHRLATRTSADNDWSERSVWLITYADQFPNDGQTPLSALDRFIDDRLTGLIDGVHILPFAPWSSDGGFSVIDYEAVDPRYGSWADIEAITSSRTVMFDAVINHMSAKSQWFQRFLADDPDHRGFFRTSDPTLDTSSVVRPRTHPLLTPFTTSSGDVVHVWTTFSADQVDLDYGNPEVLLRMLAVLIDYCERGAGAIRLDAVGFLWKDEATPSIHLPQTHQIIQLIRSCLDDLGFGALLISETNVPHEENVSYLGSDIPEVHAVYQFPLAPLTAHAALSGDTSVLERWAAGIDEIVGEQRSFLNFLACHDGIGVRPAEGLLDDDQLGLLIDACHRSGGRVGQRVSSDGSMVPYELNTTWFDLMAADVDEETAIRRHLATHAVMLCLPGVAALYAHSLFGTGNDHAAVDRTGHARDINRSHYDDRAALEASVETPGTRANQIFEGLAALVANRRRCAAFHPEAELSVLESPSGVFAVDRMYNRARARVIVNLGAIATDVGSLTENWVEIGGTRVPAPDLGPGASLWLEPTDP